MINISLTDFVDFVSKAGSSKQTKVKQIKERKDYHPATDFYKSLREKIVEFHEQGLDKKHLDEFVRTLSDKKKVDNYFQAIKGYKKFLGNRQIHWFTPPSRKWITGEVAIRINPELGLRIDSKEYVIKIYLKGEKISRDRITQILALLEKQLRSKVKEGAVFALLDVRNAKLHENHSKTISLLPLLEGEVKSFEIIWNNI